MVLRYGAFVRARRHILGLSQRELAERAGLKQPLIAAIETGRRSPSAAAQAGMDAALVITPSQALAAHRSEIHRVFESFGLSEPRVFGSVAAGTDHPGSDLDLLVEFGDHHDIVDLLTLEEQLTDLLTVDVDVIDARGDGDVLEHAARTAVAL